MQGILSARCKIQKLPNFPKSLNITAKLSKCLLLDNASQANFDIFPSKPQLKTYFYETFHSNLSEMMSYIPMRHIATLIDIKIRACDN